MQFSVYLPPESREQSVPVLIWLSGLTCTDQNFVTKAGAQMMASELGVAIVCPDTSPRGETVADDPNGEWDFGLGAGFYLNATEAPFAEHYQMQSYVVDELFDLLSSNPALDMSRVSIAGHSMGGHGALTLGLKNPTKFRSVSAFAPIAAPMQCPWGQKAFKHYLGADESNWVKYDASQLVRQADSVLPIRIDQGSADNFLEEQLKPEVFLEAARDASYPIQYQLHEGYDHSFFFIASFIGDHLEFHAKHLNI